MTIENPGEYKEGCIGGNHPHCGLSALLALHAEPNPKLASPIALYCADHHV